MPSVLNDVIMMSYMLICIMKLRLYVLPRLDLNEVTVYVEHVQVCNEMNEGLSMYRSYCK